MLDYKGNNMLDIGLWIALGAFVGWNLPQPFWAKYVQIRVVESYKKFRAA